MTATLTGAGLTFRRAEPVMGTVVSFDVRPQGLAPEAARSALREACASLHQADECFSLYRADSPLSRLRRGELSLPDAPGDIHEVLAQCQRVRELSSGWFDPWAFEGGVDPTGLVKGWAAARALRILEGAGVGAAMVNAAGDIAACGRPEPGRRWRVGVRSPEAADRLCCLLDLESAVATSGQYERGPHVLDPRTGRPASGARSATVCGPDLAVADGLATGLLAAGRDGLSAVLAAGYEAMIIDPDGAQVHTEGFPRAA